MNHESEKTRDEFLFELNKLPLQNDDNLRELDLYSVVNVRTVIIYRKLERGERNLNKLNITCFIFST